MIETMKELSRLIDEASEIFHSEADWEVKYDAIFAMNIWQKIREAGFGFDWYDPDTSYEEDVTAYFRALEGFQTRMGDLVKCGTVVDQ